MKTFTKGKFEISQFQAAHCARKNAISPKVFNRFSKTFLLLKDVENRYLGRKFHGRSYFSFAMVRWKLFSGGKIRNFPLSSCTLCQKKCYITKGIQADFQKLSFRRKMWKIGRSKKGAAVLVLQWCENFFQVEKLEISRFQAVHCVRKNAISPKVFNRFSKTFLLLKDVENRYLGRKFHGRSYFSFAMVRWKLLQKENLKFPQFQAAHRARKNAISPKVFNRSSKTFLLLNDVENRYLRQKFHGPQLF